MYKANVPDRGEITAPALLLTTTGRKSGDKFIFPLFYGTDGDGYFIVASKGGAPEHPGWYRNILADPDVEVQAGTKKFKARARTVEGEERSRLWKKALVSGRLMPTMRSRPTARFRWSCRTPFIRSRAPPGTQMTDKLHPEWMGKNRKLTPAEVKEFLARAGGRADRHHRRKRRALRDAGLARMGRRGLLDGPAGACGMDRQIKNIRTSAFRARTIAGPTADRRQAEIVAGPAPMEGDCLGVANRISQRFLGERGPEYLVPTYDRPRYLIKIVPTKMITWDGVEWAKKYTEK